MPRGFYRSILERFLDCARNEQPNAARLLCVGFTAYSARTPEQLLKQQHTAKLLKFALARPYCCPLGGNVTRLRVTKGLYSKAVFRIKPLLFASGHFPPRGQQTRRVELLSFYFLIRRSRSFNYALRITNYELNTRYAKQKSHAVLLSLTPNS